MSPSLADFKSVIGTEHPPAAITLQNPEELEGVKNTYRGDLTRNWRLENGNLTHAFKYDGGFTMLSDGGNRTYIPGLAEIIGDDPSTNGDYRYLTHDHLGSTRGIFDGTKASLGTFEYTPYGSPFLFSGPGDVTQLFTGHDLDPVTGDYYAPFRYLDPAAGRWLKQDPLGMVDGPNIYGYVGADPVNYRDPMGLRRWSEDEVNEMIKRAWCDARPIFSGPPNMFGNHGPGGSMDFNTHNPGDRFPIGDDVLTPGQFGNYLAGCAGQAYGGSLGVGAMMLSGIVFDFFDGGETRWDNDGSRDWIRRGAKDCKERFGRKKPVDWGSVTIDFGP